MLFRRQVCRLRTDEGDQIIRREHHLTAALARTDADRRMVMAALINEGRESLLHPDR